MRVGAVHTGRPHSRSPDYWSAGIAMTQTPDRVLLRFADVLARTGIPRSSLQLKIKEGRFPPGEKLAIGGIQTSTRVWDAADVDRWLAGDKDAPLSPPETPMVPVWDIGPHFESVRLRDAARAIVYLRRLERFGFRGSAHPADDKETGAHCVTLAPGKHGAEATHRDLRDCLPDLPPFRFYDERGHLVTFATESKPSGTSALAVRGTGGAP